jgi:gamma-glutamylcyclotransferase (GGCT)/AIG2-like uncharacterized protein YtfP
MLDRLFCYGTLCMPEVMQHIIGREISPVPAVLEDYTCYLLRDQRYPAAVAAEGAALEGLVYSGLTGLELMRLDRYEGVEYRRLRVSVMTLEGRRMHAWVYILRPQYEGKLSDRKFNLENFLETEAQEYTRGMPFRN